jgi:site-specific recombinase XerD
MASGVTGVIEREKGSGIWWIRYRDHLGKRHLEKVGRRGDAITLIGKRRADAQLRKKLPEKFRGGVTFGELVTDALRYSRESNGERSTAELSLKFDRMLPVFGSRPASSITVQELSNWLLEQGEEREWSPATRNRYAAAFSLVYRIGIENEKVEVNPASKLKSRKESSGRTRFLSASEEQKVRNTITRRCPRNLPAFTVSLHTGLRASEQWRLLWRDIDFDQRILTARATKNGDAERHIPLNDTAMAALKEVAASYPGRRTSTSAVFLNSDDNPMRTHRDWFEPVIEDSGIDAYTWHCNRHTFASRLVMAGVNLKAVQTLMGHRTITMTMRYSHLAPDHLTAAVATLASGDWATQRATGQNAYPAVKKQRKVKRVKSVA